MIQILLYLLIVTPFPIFYFLKYIIENMAPNSRLDVIIPNVFITIVWIEITVLYFAFNYIVFALAIMTLAIVFQAYITWIQFSNVSIQKKEEAFYFLILLKKYSLWFYIILVGLCFMVHIITEMFL